MDTSNETDTDRLDPNISRLLKKEEDLDNEVVMFKKVETS